MTIRPPFRPTRLAAGALAVALPLLLGCASSTELTNTWREPGYSDGTVSNLLVVALRKDPVRRRRWEDGFVEALGKRGVKATPSYSRWPDAPPDTQAVIQAIHEQGYDAVLSLMRLEDRYLTREGPASLQVVPVTYRDAWYGRYYTAYRQVIEPGTVEQEKLLFFQTDLWRIVPGHGRLVWSGTVKIYESLASGIIRETAEKQIVPALGAAGFVPVTRAR